MRRQTPLGRRVAVGLALLGLHTVAAHALKAGQDVASLAPPEVCESKTINYITHTLPQKCLRTSWTGPAPTAAAAEATLTGSITATQSPEATPLNETQQEQASEKEKEDPDKQDFATGSFMSFEEWKEMMLRKSGQDPAKLKDRKPHERKVERDPSIISGEPDSIGEEGEIYLNFDSLSEKFSELTSSPSGDPTPHSSTTVEEEHVLQGDGKTQYYRSKDAGKTCKERFSYSSFDAGATILKTSPGAKNPKAILVENKDSYMLLECRTKNKFVIVELSDDILVDTVVLANFEFFSSMIRKFRVSVSDRYPVKMEKWVDLGTFEARNSRDIQPFLVEHPQIYTKYIRIEFLSHYGNEYYCPVSLLRVHGTRMLDSWKEQVSSQDEEFEQIDGSAQDPIVDGNRTQAPLDASPSTTEHETPEITYVTEMGLSPWQPLFYYNSSDEICVISSPTTGDPTPVAPDGDGDQRGAAGRRESAPTQLSQATAATEPTKQAGPSTSAAASTQPAAQSQPTNASVHSPASVSQQVGSNESNDGAATSSNMKQSAARADAASESASSGSSRNGGSTSTSPTAVSRNKTSASSSAASASPTVQESFFKTITKRLQLLESNTSLSLQYIEEQSRFLQEALLKMEKKQAGRVDAFLDTLNKTVLAELRSVRTQYDQIWQSTVIALETQREQSQREIVALSERVAVLADEVVFQKRMAILQSVLLLSCLVLVIFSRGGGPASPLSSSYGSFGAGFGSPTQCHVRQDSSPRPVSTPRHHHHAQHQHYRSDKVLPMTPTSEFSREGTPVVHVDGVEVPFLGDSSPSPPQLKRQRSQTLSEGLGGDEMDDDAESECLPSVSMATEGSLRDGHRYLPQNEFGMVVAAEQDSSKPASKGRSSLLNLGSVRKPLPALPEDPS